ncbi:MAG TPA: class I SAM-dependent methyltransferase [Verrucomicrobiota bacterium]|nr:class I SAM-dependent methyltransferase [Verrucomicrobiota bacterium]
MSTQQDYYRQNEAYAEFLENWDAGFYEKYAAALRPAKAGGRVLDAGCGVGQVVARLTAAGCEAHGVDVSEPNIERARRHSPFCRLYDGRRLPYADGFFDSAGALHARANFPGPGAIPQEPCPPGALNVLEHVEEPEAFLTELCRVVRPGGRIVVSSPNFLRVLGPGYHPRMRGPANRWRNLSGLLARRRALADGKAPVRFERMAPIVRRPFRPDDDAVIVTNPVEIAAALARCGAVVERVECTDRVVPAALEWLLNATPLRWAMLNAFVVARKN